MSLIRKHVAVLQAWACLDLVFTRRQHSLLFRSPVLAMAEVSVYLDVKLLYCVKTTQARIMKSSPSAPRSL